MSLLQLPPSILDVTPDRRPSTPDTPRKAQQRVHKRELYQANPETYRARRRVANLAPHQVERVNSLSRRKYRSHRDAALEAQAKRGRERNQALRILRAVLAILDGEPVRMRARPSKHGVAL